MAQARKLFLFSATILAALALSAVPASAGITVLEEEDPGDGNHACPAGPSLAAHVVTGGCHASVPNPATVALIAHTGSSELVITNCQVTGEARGGTNGTGYITEQVFADVTPNSCTRRPCDEAASPMRTLAWPTTITDAGATTTAELTWCIRPVASGEGGSGTICTVHRQGTDLGSHTYTSVANETPCEGLPSIEVSGNLTASFVGTERVEIIND